MVCRCIGVVDGNDELKQRLTAELNELLGRYENLAGASVASNGKQILLEQFYGASLPEDATVGDPEIVITKKKSCSRKKSKREAAIERAKKPMRHCKKCDTPARHDSGNCDKVAAKKK